MVQRYDFVDDKNLFIGREVANRRNMASPDGLWIHADDYAALEAERDTVLAMLERERSDLRALAGQSESGRALTSDTIKKIIAQREALEAERDELAARLRAVKEWANGHAPGKKFPPLSRLFAALDGPVPECRACAEIMPLAKRLEGFFCNGVVAWSLLTKENMNQAADDMVEIQRILARHAADEGEEHE